MDTNSRTLFCSRTQNLWRRVSSMSFQNGGLFCNDFYWKSGYWRNWLKAPSSVFAEAHSVQVYHFLSHFEIHARKSKSRHRIERSNICRKRFWSTVCLREFWLETKIFNFLWNKAKSKSSPRTRVNKDEQGYQDYQG